MGEEERMPACGRLSSQGVVLVSCLQSGQVLTLLGLWRVLCHRLALLFQKQLKDSIATAAQELKPQWKIGQPTKGK